MNFYEQQMRQMFGSTDIIHDAKFIGKTMLGKLDEELRLKLQFVSTHTSGQYDTVQATIINRTDGVIDKENFKFADIIGPTSEKVSAILIPTCGTTEVNPNGTLPSPLPRRHRSQIPFSTISPCTRMRTCP